MIPTKCPNCRLSLPQNWSGANDPGAKCPYCGKPIAGSPAAPGAPSAPAQPAPAPKAAAKTMLWGVGVPIPGRLPDKPFPAPVPAPVAQPRPQPVPQSSPKPAPYSTKDALGESQTVPRSAISEPASAGKSAPIAPVAPAVEPADFDVDVSEAPIPEPASVAQPAVRSNQPAATVMFESAVHSGASPSRLEGVAPYTDGASEEPEPPAEPSPGPTPTRAKVKGKPLPRKVYKPKSGFSSNRGDEADDADAPKPASSKAGLIVFLVLVVAAAAVIGAVLLRGRGKSESAGQEDRGAAPKAKPLIEPVPGEEPAALAPKPAPAAPAVAEKPAPAEKPARAEKPIRAEKPAVEKPAPAEKPTRAEKPAHAEKAEPSTTPPEPKASGGKPSEEDFRHANEAYQRGNAKLMQGNTAEAIAEFNQALKLNPKDPANHRGLGLAYEKAGKSADAIKHLKLYLKASPKANDRAIIEKRIDQLKGQ